MIGSTDQFATEIASSQQVFAGAYVWNGSKMVEETLRFGFHITVAPLGFWAGYYVIGNLPPTQKLQLIEGSVTHDKRAEVWNTADVSFLDVTGTGAGQALVDPLSGYEFLLYRGIRLTGSLPGLNNWEWKPQGMFTVTNLEVIRYGTALIYKCQMSDRAQRLIDNPWKNPFQVSPSTGNTIACIKAIINDRAKGFTPVFVDLSGNSTAVASTMTFDANSSPWAACQQLAESISCEVYVDPYGSFVIAPYVDPGTARPVAIYSAGSQVILEQPDRQISKDGIYNGVIVRGNASWLLFPVTGEAWDDDPSSPTWRLGPFGEKPKIIESGLVASNATATTMAQTEFSKVKGVWEDLTFRVYPDPRLEVGDVIRIDDATLGVQQKATLEAITMPLTSGSMTAVIRRRRGG